MKNHLREYQVPLLFCALCIALFSLISFQINWLAQSRNLISQQFDQKVDLAMGASLSKFNSIYDHTSYFKNCMAANDCKYIQITDGSVGSSEMDDLRNLVSSNMMCFGISQDYEVSITSDKKTEDKKVKSYTCAINPMRKCCKDTFLAVSFPFKDQYLFDKMKFMIASSVLIFLLLATVSFIILWSLIKQKRITDNNVDFFNNTAHELKTPLTNISLALNLLGRKYENIKEDKYAQIIKRENTKLADQIERVLYLSRMENGEYTFRKEDLNPKLVITEVVNHMQMIIEEYKGTINLNFPKEDYIVKGDYFHLSNVFKNIIDNALKYCERNPIIDISIIKVESGIKLIFSDNGIGIGKHDQEHIFKKFQRVNTGDVSNSKGFGIGLSYVKTVIEMHKGIINVLSELNKGSQFELYIPHN